VKAFFSDLSLPVAYHVLRRLNTWTLGFWNRRERRPCVHSRHACALEDPKHRKLRERFIFSQVRRSVSHLMSRFLSSYLSLSLDAVNAVLQCTCIIVFIHRSPRLLFLFASPFIQPRLPLPGLLIPYRQSIQAAPQEHSSSPKKHAPRQLVPEQPDTQHQRQEFPNVEHNADCKGGGLC